MSTQCQHGQLARQCLNCEQAAEIERLRAQQPEDGGCVLDAAAFAAQRRGKQRRQAQLAGVGLTAGLCPVEDKMKDYRLTIKVRNNRLLKAIEAAGGTPGGKWCAANGLGYARVNDLVNMTSSPLTAEGKLHRNAARLCEVLGKLPEDLWSNEQLYPLERNFSDMEMDHAQVVALLPQEQQSYLPDFSEFERAQTKALLSKAVSTLTQREQEVIRMRFTDDLALEECGNRLDLTHERVRQIEAKALRKMRHPARVGMFIDAVDCYSEKERTEAKQATAKWIEEVGAGTTATEGPN